jgi:hypothetical protein
VRRDALRRAAANDAVAVELENKATGGNSYWAAAPARGAS